MKFFKKKNYKINITNHGYISSIYFNNIFSNIIKIISKNKKKNIKVLDFGCGNGYLKKKLKENKKIRVIGYDIVKELTETSNWKKVKFDYFVSCHVFMYLNKIKIKNIINFIKKQRPNAKIIVAISRQSFLNKIGAFILNERNAYTNVCLSSAEEISILQKHLKIVEKKNVFFLTDIYLMRF
jgi:SAM-dependent methyltransferase